jgi:hypothetical protein
MKRRAGHQDRRRAGRRAAAWRNKAKRDETEAKRNEMEAKPGEAGDCALARRKSLIVKGGETSDCAATSVSKGLGPISFRTTFAPRASSRLALSREERRYSLPGFLFFRKIKSRLRTH